MKLMAVLCGAWSIFAINIICVLNHRCSGGIAIKRRFSKWDELKEMQNVELKRILWNKLNIFMKFNKFLIKFSTTQQQCREFSWKDFNTANFRYQAHFFNNFFPHTIIFFFSESFLSQRCEMYTFTYEEFLQCKQLSSSFPFNSSKMCNEEVSIHSLSLSFSCNLVYRLIASMHLLNVWDAIEFRYSQCIMTL